MLIQTLKRNIFSHEYNSVQIDIKGVQDKMQEENGNFFLGASTMDSTTSSRFVCESNVWKLWRLRSRASLGFSVQFSRLSSTVKSLSMGSKGAEDAWSGSLMMLEAHDDVLASSWEAMKIDV